MIDHYSLKQIYLPEPSDQVNSVQFISVQLNSCFYAACVTITRVSRLFAETQGRTPTSNSDMEETLSRFICEDPPVDGQMSRGGGGGRGGRPDRTRKRIDTYIKYTPQHENILVIMSIKSLEGQRSEVRDQYITMGLVIY